MLNFDSQTKMVFFTYINKISSLLSTLKIYKFILTHRPDIKKHKDVMDGYIVEIKTASLRFCT